FGISSGTSNCKADKDLAKLIEQEKFFVANFHQISKEASQGSGSALSELSARLGCPKESQGDVNRLIQQRFEFIFSAPGAVTSLKRTKTTLRSDDSLGEVCRDLV